MYCVKRKPPLNEGNLNSVYMCCPERRYKLEQHMNTFFTAGWKFGQQIFAILKRKKVT
jgi:hypothetical protein